MANISFFNNKFLVTFGSNILSIICYDKLELIKSIGGLGLSKYSFREPVFGRFDSEIYVCDWHNNRVVIYDKNLRYISEFGSTGFTTKNRNPLELFLRIFKYILKLSYKGSYISSFFSGKDNNKSLKNLFLRYSPSLGIKNLFTLSKILV